MRATLSPAKLSSIISAKGSLMSCFTRFMLLMVVISFSSMLGHAQSGRNQNTSSNSNTSSTTPPDQPFSADTDEAKKIEEAIKPYIEKARKTYPEAKKRFLAGLPPQHSFLITTRLHDSQGRFEQVFIRVREIKDGIIKGVIASEIEFISGYKEGDSYSFPESELIDWTITKPDGTEEGNFVGKFLDEYQKQ
jgi:hypothetical protein